MGFTDKTVSPQRLEANRENSQKSTGPRTPEGKARASLNALKPVALEVLPATADGGEVARLRRDLLGSFEAADGLAARMVEDLVELYDQLARERRLQAALRRREREKQEAAVRRREWEIRSSSYPAESIATPPGGLMAAPDSVAKFKLALQHIQAIIDRVRSHQLQIGDSGWDLFNLYGRSCSEHVSKITNSFNGSLTYGTPHEPSEAERLELLRMLLEDQRQLEQDYEAFKKRPASTDAEREVAMALSTPQWILSTRRESSLLRAIDRKYWLLVEYAKRAGKGHAPDSSPDDDEASAPMGEGEEGRAESGEGAETNHD